MYNQMNYPYIPNPNMMMNPFCNNNTNYDKMGELEKEVSKLERSLKQLEARISVLENNGSMYSVNANNASGMYMV